MLTVLGRLAEFERDLIRARRQDGAAAQAHSPPAERRDQAIKRRERGEESLAEIGRSYNVSAATISRLTA